MNYLYVSKKKQPKHRNGGWIILILVCGIVAALMFWGASLFSVFTSLWIAETVAMDATASATFAMRSKADLVAEIEELKDRNDGLAAKLTLLEAKAMTYDDLVGEIGTTTDLVEGTLAKIIRRPPFTIFDAYVIDRGSVHDVEVGDIAYAHDMPVGTVQSVTDSNSTIHLYSSPGEKLLIAFGTTSLQYEGYGIGNGMIRADVPRDTPVEKDMRVTADDRSVSVVGTVIAVDKASNNTSASVFIALPFDIARTGWLIIKKQ